MSRIYLDANVYIYFLEEDQKLASAAKSIFSSLSHPSHRLFATLYTSSELLLTHVKANGEFKIAYVRRFFRSPNVTHLDFRLRQP